MRKLPFILSPLTPLLLLAALGLLFSPVTGASQAQTRNVSVTRILPNYNSCKVLFAAVPGAVDYRVYNISHTHHTGHGDSPMYKYSGGALSVEINDLDINATEQPQYVVEALDRFGPYQYSDAYTPHSEMYSINGRVVDGDEPVVIARSAPFRPVCGPRYNAPTPGAQVLFEEFWAGSTPFQETVIPYLTKAEKALTAFFGDPNTHQRYQNDKWTVDFTGHVFGQSQVFVHPGAAHMMDWLEDGGSKSGNIPAHVNQANAVFAPRDVVIDLSTGKTAHLSFEVDAHFSSRRWLDVWAIPAGAELKNPADPATAKRPVSDDGTALRWKVLDNVHEVRIWRDNTPTTEKLTGVGTKPYAFRRGEVGLNGDDTDLDNRHRFDLYLSRTHIRATETDASGKVFVIADQDLSEPLPMQRIEFRIVHRVYHTKLDTKDDYFRDVSPHRDLRHWGPVRIEVL